MSTKMATTEPWHFDSGEKLPMSETHLAKRHTWDICTCNYNSHVCRVGPPRDRTLGKVPTCHQGCQDTYQETQKWGVHHFQSMTESGSRPLLREPSSTHHSAAPLPCWSPLASATGGSASWTEDFICPTVHLALEILPCKTLTTSLPTLLSPGRADWESRTGVHYSSLIDVCVLYSSWIVRVWVGY